MGLLLTKVKKQSNNSASPPENLADQAFAVTGCCLCCSQRYFSKGSDSRASLRCARNDRICHPEEVRRPDVRIGRLEKSGEQKGKRLIAASPRRLLAMTGFKRWIPTLRSSSLGMTIQGHPEEVRRPDVRIGRLEKSGEQKGKRLIAVSPRRLLAMTGFKRWIPTLRSSSLGMTIQGHPEEVRRPDVRIRPRS